MKTKNLQRGATLLVGLIMLVILTLFAISAINLSSANLKIVGNMQAQKQMEAAGDQAIQQVIGSVTFFNEAINNTGAWPAGTQEIIVPVNPGPNVVNVTVARPACVSTVVAEGYSALSTVSPEDNIYEVRATATDPVTNASVTATQGIKIRMTAGNCL